MSPKNIIEGIHTRRGRVVYRRKKHVWSNSDLARILKNIGKTIAEDYAGDVCGELLILNDHLISGLFTSARASKARACGENNALMYKALGGVMDWLYDVDKESIDSFGGGQYAGAGATREGF